MFCSKTFCVLTKTPLPLESFLLMHYISKAYHKAAVTPLRCLSLALSNRYVINIKIVVDDYFENFDFFHLWNLMTIDRNVTDSPGKHFGVNDIKFVSSIFSERLLTFTQEFIFEIPFLKGHLEWHIHVLYQSLIIGILTSEMIEIIYKNRSIKTKKDYTQPHWNVPQLVMWRCKKV